MINYKNMHTCNYNVVFYKKITCGQVPFHGRDGRPGAQLGRRGVVVLGQHVAVRKPEVAARRDDDAATLVVLDHGPVVEAEMVPEQGDQGPM
jgi:hypothetical protein